MDEEIYEQDEVYDPEEAELTIGVRPYDYTKGSYVPADEFFND